MSTTVAVPVSGDEEFRREWWDYVLANAEPWHHRILSALYDHWCAVNRDHYAGALIPPYVLLTPPAHTRALADTSNVSSFGGRCQIRIRPNIVTGKHPKMAEGSQFADGRRRFVDDVLLHEMIHQWQFEVSGQHEKGYRGHGPAFRDVANRIGATLGLPPVRSCKKRGPDKDLPSCAQWPHNVRPEGYYLGAYPVEAEGIPEGVPAGGDTVMCPHCAGTGRMRDSEQVRATRKAVEDRIAEVVAEWNTG